MAEIIITEESDDESGEVLAEAAVMSAAVAGHADATAERAVEWTGEVAEEVEEVEALATEAAVVAASKPGREEVDEIVELKIEDAMSRLADLLSERMAPAATPEPVAEVKKDEAPPSVKKSRKRKSFAERYYGLGSDDD
jgi:chorismate mutase